MNMTLIIGNKNYSSWSLRPWFYLKHHGISFDEIRIPLYREDSKKRILTYSPSGKVPLLINGDIHVWDSLAILEYLAELYPETHGWPENMQSRALARSLSSEMHSGFQALRSCCSMNCRRLPKGKNLSEEVIKDITRISKIWQDCRNQFADEGPWLLGKFSILDAMYAPVALRVRIYQLDVGTIEQGYVNTIHNDPAIREWIEAGKQETEIIQAFED